MNKTIIAGLCIIILLSVPVLADLREIDMKTNEEYTARFIAENIQGTVLVNCIPYLDGNLEGEDWVKIKPSKFNLEPGEEQDIILTFSYPPVGYYEGGMQISCERYYQGEFVGIYDIIEPETRPEFRLKVKLAGAGQSYSIFPSKTYNFIGKPGITERAKFSIANLGTTDLTTSFEIKPEYNNIISITPPRKTIPIDEIQQYTIEINLPEDFTNMNTTIDVFIGDYGDTFTITGETETFRTTGAAVQSVAFTGETNVLGIKIPNWTIIGGLLIAGFMIFQELYNPKKKRRKKK